VYGTRGFGLADAYVLATARRKSSKILTGDPTSRMLEKRLIKIEVVFFSKPT